MQPRPVFVEALAVELPSQRVTSVAIEDALAPTYQRLGIPKGCIETLVGITERRFWDEGTAIADVAARAAQKAYAQTGRGAALVERTGMVLSTSVSKDYIEPSVAALVHGQVGLRDTCVGFDIGNACLGFMSGMELAASAIESGRIDAALVVAGESSRHVVTRTIERLNAEATAMDHFKEALPTLTLGSGAVAAVLVHERLAQSGHRVGHSVTLADNTASTICLGTPDWMKTDAQRLLHSGVALGKRTWAAAGEQLGFHVDTVDQYICHQVGATHMATLFGALALPLDRAFLTYPQLGNIGPAAVPLTLRLCADAGRLKSGDKLALMGIGSGLNCMMMEMTW